MIASPACVAGAVRVGGVAPLGPRQVPSGYRKYAVAGPVAVGPLGLAGDAQADLRVHGGRNKAVYGYPASAYPIWRARVPEHAARLVAGSMGENLTIDGWSDADVAVGDIVRVGTALLQVTEPRQPCYKLGLVFGDARMPRLFGEVGISGWYHRVLEAGHVAADDAVCCLDRPNPGWTIARFFAMISRGVIDNDALAEIVALEGVGDGWRLKALALLARRGAA